MMVRALAVKQPFAGLIANGTKKEEYRTWSTDYRGPILIVASRGRNREATEQARRRGQLTATDEPKGATLCVVDRGDVRWSAKTDDYTWKLARPRAVPVTPIKGKLNLYKEEVPDDWSVYFGAAAASNATAEVTPKRTRGASVPRRVKKTGAKPRDPAEVARARKKYKALLREWNAAGSPPDVRKVRALQRAQRAWKGP